ncbi:hypothetical protein Pcinc_030573, partial [Petrolisthes cinctipes]
CCKYQPLTDDDNNNPTDCNEGKTNIANPQRCRQIITSPTEIDYRKDLPKSLTSRQQHQKNNNINTATSPTSVARTQSRKRSSGRACVLLVYRKPNQDNKEGKGHTTNTTTNNNTTNNNNNSGSVCR